MTAPVARTVRLAAAALVLTIVVGLAACGVSSQHTATRIESDDVPFGLLDDETTTTAVDAGRTTSVYLLSKDRLVPVDRSVPDDATLEDLLDQVITGPTEVEQSLGITTAVPAGTVASVDTSRGIAEVDLTSSFGDIRSGEQILALGQIVYTLTGQPGIGGVQFTVEGKEVTVPLSDGNPSDDPLSRDDFDPIAPK
jgi:spore germination protein GerM